MKSNLREARNLTFLLTVIFAVLFAVACPFNAAVAVVMLVLAFVFIVLGIVVYGGIEEPE